jgi:all-trans-retinol 13,14-reductase
MKYDIIIVGAGLGGLTAGAKLTREGKKVLVIEQHSKPGGCATTFRRGDFTMEVGLHEMDGPSPKDMKTRIFNDLDVFNNVKFVRVPEFYRFVNGRVDLVLPHDPVEAARILKESFPGETAGIDAFFSQLLNPKRKAAGEDNLTDRSLGTFLDSIIRNEDLKLVLLGNLGYFSDDPYSISLIYYSVAQGSYFTGGASYIFGGSQKLSDYLSKFIKDHGGEVILNHLVTGFITADNKVKGVKFRKRKSVQEDLSEAFADEFIVNGAIPGIPDLLPEDLGKRFRDEITMQKPGNSLLTIYFGFRGLLKDIGNRYYSNFVFDDSVLTQKDIAKNNRGDYRKRNFAFADYGMIDSGLAPEGKSVGALCCTDYVEDWDHLSREEYIARKEEVARIFIDRLEALLPGIGEKIEYYEVGTSVTVRRYTLNTNGAVYGFVQTPSKPPINTSGILENMHFASQWGKTGGGFSGAIYGGYLCAYSVLKKINAR